MKCGCGGTLKSVTGFFSSLIKGEVKVYVCNKCGKKVKQ